MLGACIFDDGAGNIWKEPARGAGGLKPLMLSLALKVNFWLGQVNPEAFRKFPVDFVSTKHFLYISESETGR